MVYSTHDSFICDAQGVFRQTLDEGKQSRLFGPEHIKSGACQPGAGHRHIPQVPKGPVEVFENGIDDIVRIKSAMHDGRSLIVLKFNTSYIVNTRSGLLSVWLCPLMMNVTASMGCFLVDG
jgi:hypothetical protein